MATSGSRPINIVAPKEPDADLLFLIHNLPFRFHLRILDRRGSRMADDEDTSLIAAQEAFLSSGTRPAAKIIRTRGGPATPRQEPRPIAEETSGPARHGPGWYQQMKGVRFRIDDLEDENDAPAQTARNKRPGNTESLGSAIMGDIVERGTSSAAPVFSLPESQKSTNGFPAPRKFTPSRVTSKATPMQFSILENRTPTRQLEGKALMEEIDRENRKKLAGMSEHEILELQKSLQSSIPKELQQLLLQKTESSKSEAQSSKPMAENPTALKQTKSKGLPTVDPTMDDQSFDSHLRTFFPSSTTSVSPPEWTLPVHPAEETFYSTPDPEAPVPSTMRFDFNGRYIVPHKSRSLPTHLGLHHHSLDPGAAGYTLAELAILARSVQPSQKCIALKILGGVLADIAGGEYEWDVSEGLWDEIEGERVIEIVLEIAKGGREAAGNRSVQRYAEDAVTRWVDAGGPKIWEERLRKKGFEKVEQDTNDS